MPWPPALTRNALSERIGPRQQPRRRLKDESGQLIGARVRSRRSASVCLCSAADCVSRCRLIIRRRC